MRAQADDLAVFRQRQLAGADAVGLVAGADQVLGAILDPLDRPAGAHREQRDDRDVGKERRLDPEAAADVLGHDHAQLLVRHPQRAGEHRQERHRAHEVRPDRQQSGRGLVVGDDPVRLDRGRAVPLPAQRLGDDDVRTSEGAVGVAVAKRPVDDDVRPDLLVQQRLRRVERVLDGDDRVERLVVGEDDLGCVLGQVARLGGDRRDRLARVPRAVDGHPVEGELVRDPGRERLGQAGKLGAGERSDDARRLERGGEVDRADVGVRPRRAGEGDVERARKREVVHERPAAG